MSRKLARLVAVVILLAVLKTVGEDYYEAVKAEEAYSLISESVSDSESVWESIPETDEAETLSLSLDNEVSKAAEEVVEEVVEEEEVIEEVKELAVISINGAPADLEDVFNAYHDVNEDVLAVICIPTLGIEYPVLSGTEYMNVLVTGETNGSGSINLSDNASNDMSDRVSLISGHNMKDGTMFGSLDSFVYEDGAALLAECPYVYIYVGATEETLVYQIGAYGTIPYGDEVVFGTYGSDITDEQFDSYVAYTSTWEYCDSDLMAEAENIVTLRACYQKAHEKYMVVSAVLLGELAD